MEFGLFTEFHSPPGVTEAAAFDESLAQMKVGGRGLRLRRSVRASPLIVASALAACTQRVKIGIAVQVLPLSHPLRLAEDIATVEGKSPTSACSAGRWSGSSARGGGLQGAQDTRLGGCGGAMWPLLFTSLPRSATPSNSHPSATGLMMIRWTPSFRNADRTPTGSCSVAGGPVKCEGS